MTDVGNLLETGIKRCEGSEPLQGLSIGGSVQLEWNVMIWTGFKYVFRAYFVSAPCSLLCC
jgi:hypothetical protein